MTRKPAQPKLVAKRATAPKSPSRKATRTSGVSKARTTKKPAAKVSRKATPVAAKGHQLQARKTPTRKTPVASRPKKIEKVVAAVPRVKKTQIPVRAIRAQRPVTPAHPPRQPTLDESSALRAFDRAHREFTRGRFGEARNQFHALLDKYAQVAEVAARARTYLAIAEARLRTDSMLPRDADSLYDRGVIELNRGEYVAAQEMFERALRREPEAAHIHYGLAATRARLGSIDLALQSLQRALDLQPSLRVRAQHDQDLTPLRSDPDFDRLVFAPRI